MCAYYVLLLSPLRRLKGKHAAGTEGGLSAAALHAAHVCSDGETRASDVWCCQLSYQAWPVRWFYCPAVSYTSMVQVALVILLLFALARPEHINMQAFVGIVWGIV